MDRGDDNLSRLIVWIERVIHAQLKHDVLDRDARTSCLNILDHLLEQSDVSEFELNPVFFFLVLIADVILVARTCQDVLDSLQWIVPHRFYVAQENKVHGQLIVPTLESSQQITIEASVGYISNLF